MFHRILDQLNDLLLFAMVSLIFGIVKVLSVPSSDCLKCNVGTLVISVVIGTLAGALALQYNFGDYTAITISSVASLLSRDIVMAIINNRQGLSSLVKRAAENLVDRFTK